MFNRREFLKAATLLPLGAASAFEFESISAFGAPQPIQREGGPMLRVSLNAYSFSKLLNDKVKRNQGGAPNLVLLLASGMTPMQIRSTK